MSTDDNESFFARYIDGREKGHQQPGAEQEPQEELEPDSPEPKKPEAEAEVIQFPSSKKYLDPSTNIETLQLPLVRFPGVKRVIPEREMTCNGWTEWTTEVAPKTAPLSEQKKHVQYYVSGQLKEAELTEAGQRQKGLSAGQSTIGKQRSSAHIASLGPVLFLDDDGDVFARESQLREFGAAAVVYSSFSYGFVKEGATEPSLGGRTVLCGNRSWTPEEHGALFDGFNHLLGGGFDEHGRSPALCYGRHVKRNEDAPCKRLVIEGYAFNVDHLLELGRSLRPQFESKKFEKASPERKYAIAEELERMQLMGMVRPPDVYNEWMSCAAACKRQFPGDMEIAFECYDIWSECSSKYEGSEATRKKFDEVSAEYKGEAIPVTLEMLHWRARRRAENVIRAVYSPKIGPIADAFKALPIENLASGIPCPKGGEPIPPGTVGPKDGLIALEYLMFCWSERALENLRVPKHALDEARGLNNARREQIDLGDRTLVRWNGKNLWAATATLAEGIVDAGAPFLKVDRTLVTVSDPMSDPAIAARLRKFYEYDGPPGGPKDPVQGGMRLLPILTSDLEALRADIAKYVATEIRVNLNRGTGQKAIWVSQIVSFAFNEKNIQLGPDGNVLKDLAKRALPDRLPEVNGIITAPVMPNLPASAKPEDLLRNNAGYIITEPGFDAASGLYLAPIRKIVAVPDKPTQDEVKVAAELLRLLFIDFPFAPPGEDLDADVSRSVSIYGAMIAANRRALPRAPGIGFSSHGEGMSQGKTLAAMVITAIATGTVPIPVALSPEFGEQDKQITTYLLVGDGSLFLDNIAVGTRFDSTTIAKIMTAERYRGRLLGSNKPIEVSTRVMITVTGNSLNTASDIASRLLLSYLDSGLERPQDRSTDNYKISDLIPYVIERRQEIVAAVFTLIRDYLQACQQHGGTPPEVVARRRVEGTRSGGQCEFLRDAFLHAFPELPDPFLGFIASTAASATREDKARVLSMLDQHMLIEAGRKYAPEWATTEPTMALNAKDSTEHGVWQAAFLLRWHRLSPDQLLQYFGTTNFNQAEPQVWHRIKRAMLVRRGRPKVRSGQIKFTTKDILQMCSRDEELSAALQAVLPKGHTLNSSSLGKWLWNQLAQAPIDGLVMRRLQNKKTKANYFWIELVNKPT